jgi:hypothetical protein
MKTLVSYVLQEKDRHEHLSEVLDITDPPVTYSTEIPVSQVIQWAKEKRRALSPDQELIILGIYRF